MYSTLLLNTKTWDLTVDDFGNIASTKPPYAVAQDISSACRLFEGELYYNTTKGVPYNTEILGYKPPASLIMARIEGAALSVPGVKSARFEMKPINSSRNVSGHLFFTTEDGGSYVI